MQAERPFSARTAEQIIKNDRRTIFGWAMYDWANSAYATTIAGALLPAYFADSIVPEGGYEIFGRAFDGATLWGAVVGFGAFLLFLLTPVLGAIADFSASKKRFLTVFAYGGAVFTVLLFFMTTGDVALTLGLFLLAQMGFVGANVFYDGFLPDISTDDTIDRVSSKGFAYGYVGGGLQLLIAAVIIMVHDSLGMTQEFAARIGILTAALWWAGFSWFAFRFFGETGTPQTMPEHYRRLPAPRAYVRLGFDRTVATAKRLRHFPQLVLFLVAYMLYNDGVQTTINLTSVYATEALELEATTILLAFLLVQFVAFGGALLFGWLADRWSTKRAILASLGVWNVVAVLAFMLPARQVAPFLGLAVLVGVVLGGIQALSRSLYGSMIPEEASAEFYGFFSVFSKFSAMWGPLIFAFINEVTGSARWAILSIIVFFVLGAAVLSRVDVDAARASRERWSFEGAEVA